MSYIDCGHLRFDYVLAMEVILGEPMEVVDTAVRHLSLLIHGQLGSSSLPGSSVSVYQTLSEVNSGPKRKAGDQEHIPPAFSADRNSAPDRLLSAVTYHGGSQVWPSSKLVTNKLGSSESAIN